MSDTSSTDSQNIDENIKIDIENVTEVDLDNEIKKFVDEGNLKEIDETKIKRKRKREEDGTSNDDDRPSKKRKVIYISNAEEEKRSAKKKEIEKKREERLALKKIKFLEQENKKNIEKGLGLTEEEINVIVEGRMFEDSKPKIKKGYNLFKDEIKKSYEKSIAGKNVLSLFSIPLPSIIIICQQHPLWNTNHHYFISLIQDYYKKTFGVSKSEAKETINVRNQWVNVAAQIYVKKCKSGSVYVADIPLFKHQPLDVQHEILRLTADMSDFTGHQNLKMSITYSGTDKDIEHFQNEMIRKGNHCTTTISFNITKIQ